MRKVIFTCIVAVVLLSICITIAAVSGIATETYSTTDTTKYTPPSISEIVGDKTLPEPLNSDNSSLAKEKEWYEYITYADEPIQTTAKPDWETNRGSMLEIFRLLGFNIPRGDANVRIAYYDPVDYTNATVMKIGNTVSLQYNSGTTLEDKFSQGLGSDGVEIKFSTANSLSANYESSKTVIHSTNHKVTVQSETEFEIKVVFGAIKEKITLAYNVDVFDETTTFESTKITQNFNAMYFNSNGTPCPWRVISYSVLLPVKCVLEYNINGEWISEEQTECYVLLPTVQGVCRQWIDNGSIYYEHWATGDAVTATNFWTGYFGEEELIIAYKNKLLPN